MDWDEMDEDLLELLRAAFAEPPHQVTVASVRRRMLRRRTMEAVTGTAAVTAAIGVAVPALAGTFASAPPTRAGYPTASHRPAPAPTETPSTPPSPPPSPGPTPAPTHTPSTPPSPPPSPSPVPTARPSRTPQPSPLPTPTARPSRAPQPTPTPAAISHKPRR